MIELNPTGRLILGMLALGLRTGYDIKQLADKSTRHFWAVSYGQLYPELRRLEEAGLVAGRSEPSGGRPRQVYELTDAGWAELREWLEAPSTTSWEVRSEVLLKLFFSDFAEEVATREQIAALRRRHEEKLATLRAMDAGAAEWRHRGPYRTLRFGIELSEWVVDWCRREELPAADTDSEE